MVGTYDRRKEAGLTQNQRATLERLQAIGSVTLQIHIKFVRRGRKRSIRRQWSPPGFNSNVLNSLEKARVVEGKGSMPGVFDGGTEGVWEKTWTPKV